MADDRLSSDVEAERMAQARLRVALSRRPDPPARAPSHAALGKEFLRRMAAWATALGCEDQWPLFDVAQRAVPTLGAPAIPPGLDGRLWIVRQTMAWWVRYVGLAAHPAIAAHGLPDPYLPLVRLLERGGSYYTEQKTLFAGPRGIYYRIPLPLPPAWQANALDLTDVALDAIDAAEATQAGG